VDSTDSTDSFSCAQELPEEDVEIEVPDSMLDVIIPESSLSSKSLGPAPFYKVPTKSDAKEMKKNSPCSLSNTLLVKWLSSLPLSMQQWFRWSHTR
jgi:hypothetical protein